MSDLDKRKAVRNSPQPGPVPRLSSLAGDSHHPEHLPLDDDAFEYSRYLVMLARSWRNILDERLRKLGLTSARWQTLCWIAVARPDDTQRELAERVGISSPTLVRILHGLEEQGLVQREIVEGNRRANRVMLTPQAKELIVEIEAIAKDVREDMLQDVTPEELEICLSVFHRVHRRMKPDKSFC